jgi:hypothetical protein
LEGEVGLRDAGRVRDLLIEAASVPGKVELDVCAVTGVDVAVLQLVASARKSVTALGGTMTLITMPGGPFETTVAKAGLLGLDGTCRSPEEHFWRGTAIGA